MAAVMHSIRWRCECEKGSPLPLPRARSGTPLAASPYSFSAQTPPGSWSVGALWIEDRLRTAEAWRSGAGRSGAGPNTTEQQLPPNLVGLAPNLLGDNRFHPTGDLHQGAASPLLTSPAPLTPPCPAAQPLGLENLAWRMRAKAGCRSGEYPMRGSSWFQAQYLTWQYINTAYVFPGCKLYPAVS